MKNTTSKKYITFPNQKRSTIIEVEGIKIGIIGLITVETPSSTKTELKDLEFEEYWKIINREIEYLKKSGVNAIIVIGHVGLN